MQAAFAWAPDYRNYFAVKATPTPKILEILLQEGMGLDCSSRTELEIAKRLQVPSQKIFYTSNNTPVADFQLAIELGAIINLDDLTQVRVLKELLGSKRYPQLALRYNPGDQKSGNAFIGQPTESKFGMSLTQLMEAVELISLNVKDLGLHTMVASNELSGDYFSDTARLLAEAAAAIQASGQKVSFINIGGGFGVNYLPDQAEFSLNTTAQLIKSELKKAKLASESRIYTENGRFITGPHGFLLSRVQYVMRKYKDYLGLDASMHNLMRPSMYGAYHHLTILGKETARRSQRYDIVGSLCENNDKFAIDRLLPRVVTGDIVAIHDVGAHGHSMDFNYNGLLRSAEVLLSKSSSPLLIRRSETIEDYLQTAIF